MQEIQFITGNPGKFREASALIPSLQQLDLDLPEIQSLDPKEVIENKLQAAQKLSPGEYIVEDTSLFLDGINGFPGPLIKWLLKAVGTSGIFDLVNNIGDYNATAVTMIGYLNSEGDIQYFKGELHGKIAKPIGETGQGFGWDEVFKPDGIDETFAEMGDELKAQFSMRTQAFNQLSDYLQSK